jgi:hypothetical protein
MGQVRHGFACFAFLFPVNKFFIKVFVSLSLFELVINNINPLLIVSLLDDGIGSLFKFIHGLNG